MIRDRYLLIYHYVLLLQSEQHVKERLKNRNGVLLREEKYRKAAARDLPQVRVPQ